MRGEYLLLDIIAVLVFLGLYKLFKLDFFSEKKALLKTFAIVFAILVVWETLALWRGHWWFGDEFVIGYVGIVPISELIFLGVITPFLALTLWETGKKIAKKWD